MKKDYRSGWETIFMALMNTNLNFQCFKLHLHSTKLASEYKNQISTDTKFNADLAASILTIILPVLIFVKFNHKTSLSSMNMYLSMLCRTFLYLVYLTQLKIEYSRFFKSRTVNNNSRITGFIILHRPDP